MAFYDNLTSELMATGLLQDIWWDEDGSEDLLYMTPYSPLNKMEGALIEDIIAEDGYGYDTIWSFDFPNRGDIEVRLR
tara:strand:+ start:8164 stop:8397 length:234 start_codon:yes stop_codon:yes gene_type:complete